MLSNPPCPPGGYHVVWRGSERITSSEKNVSWLRDWTSLITVHFSSNASSSSPPPQDLYYLLVLNYAISFGGLIISVEE